MSFLQSEILLAIFKNLDSKEMHNIRTVSQFWFQVIDENKTLWRAFNPPIENLGDQQRHNEEVGDDEEEIRDEIEKTVIVRKRSTVELFDRKSQSSLQEVSMDGFYGYDLVQLAEILSRSKETLRILNFSSPYLNEEVVDLSWRLPHLVDCRLLYQGSVNKIRLTPKMPLIDERSYLKVLWISTSCKRLFGNHLHLLGNLVSLKVTCWKNGSEWRSILDKPSRTLKHLAIKITYNDHSPESTELLFPALQVLEIESRDDTFPSWFRIYGSSLTLISNSKLMFSLPSISTLWIDDLTCIGQMMDQCPELRILRANVTGPSRKEREARRGSSLPILAKFRPRKSQFSQRGGLLQRHARRQPPQDPGASLIQALEERKGSVNNGMEVDGIKMKQIKTLIVPFEALYREELEELRELVEEVIDLKTSARFVEVEI